MLVSSGTIRNLFAYLIIGREYVLSGAGSWGARIQAVVMYGDGGTTMILCSGMEHGIKYT
jgi:hypothetical protein